MKKIFTTLLALSLCTFAGAQSLSDFDLELGYSASVDAPNSMQSLRLINESGVALHLDMFVSDAYAPSGFPGGPNELGGIYLGFNHDVLEGLMPGITYEIAAGLLVDAQNKIAEIKFVDPEMAFKHSLKYALPIDAVDAKLEASYMFSSATHANGAYVGLSTRWSIF